MNKQTNKEARLYAIWGIVSAALNIVMANTLVLAGMDYRLSNIITLITVKIFVYFTNKVFVFKTPFANIIEVIKEMFRFVLARGISFMIDYFGTILLVEFLGITFFLTKCIMSVGVIAFNFVLSKVVVFKSK